MKAFERQRSDKLDHPEDMFVIVACLEKMGKLNVGVNTLEDLYYEFSDKCACGWRSVNAESISDFAEWLEEREI